MGADSHAENHIFNPAGGGYGRQPAPGDGYGGDYTSLVNTCLQGRGNSGASAIGPDETGFLAGVQGQFSSFQEALRPAL